MTAIVTLHDIGISYGSFTALQGVSLEIMEGEILAIIGPNGAGKTSLIEIIEGLRHHTLGTVSVFGYKPSQNRRKLYKNIGLQLQEVEYPAKLRVAEICHWFNALYSNQSKVTSLLKIFTLDKVKKLYISDLSGGQKQKLAILLALLSQPKLLLLDELTTGMDPSSKHQMWELILTLKQQGTTIVIISHYMDEVAYLSDRVAYMNAGQLLFCDATDQFIAFVRAQLADSQISDDASLEELFLLLNTKGQVIPNAPL